MSNPMLNVNDPAVLFIIKQAQFEARQYAGLTRYIAQSKQRMQSMVWVTSEEAKQDPQIKALESIKHKYERNLSKLAENWPLWSRWLKHCPGIAGPSAIPLILAWYYKFIPICRKCGADLEDDFSCLDCGAKAKGDGLLKQRCLVRYDDPVHEGFRTLSKWRKFCGRHVGDDGKMPKRKKGEAVCWKTELRTITYSISDQFVRQKLSTPYGRYYRERKEKVRQRHPEKKDGHVNNMAKHETVSLFLSHFWQVARYLDGKSYEPSYVEGVLGHEHHIPPFHFEELQDLDEAK